MSNEENELLKLYETQYTGRLFEKATTYLLERNALFDERDKLNKEIDRLNNIINELEKWIDEYYKSNRKWYNNELSNHDRRYYEREYINTEAMLVKFDKKLKELKENNNE